MTPVSRHFGFVIVWVGREDEANLVLERLNSVGSALEFTVCVGCENEKERISEPEKNGLYNLFDAQARLVPSI